MTTARRPPDHLPILERSARPLVGPVYVEREVTAPVDLCDARGRSNPDARARRRAYV